MAGKPRNVLAKPVKKGGHSFLKGPKQAGVKESKGGKLTSVKNQIRGVQRLLSKDTLDAKIRRNLEGKLAQLQENQAKHNQVEIERKFAVRYHKIRFFERVKLERRINQIKSKQVRGHALSAEEQQQLTDAKADLQYVMYFPKGERYVSVVKDAAEPEAQAALVAERARLRKLIKHQMAEIAMIADADEGLGQNADEAAPTADAEADAFFLQDESAEALQQSPTDAVWTEVLPSGDDAPVERPIGNNAKGNAASQPKANLLPMPPPQLQQQQTQHQKQQKRKREPDALSRNKVHVKDVQSLCGSVADHHELHPADLHSTDKLGLTAEPAENSKASQRETADMSHSQHASAGKLKVAASHCSDDSNRTQPRLKKQLAQQQEQSGNGQVSKRLTPADRSRLLLQKLQRKHGKQDSSQPGPVKSAVHLNTQDALRTCKAASHVKQGFEPKQLRESLIRPVQSNVLPGKGKKDTTKLQLVTSRRAVGPASAQSNVDRKQAVKAPTRSRAEGGRKRRR